MTGFVMVVVVGVGGKDILHENESDQDETKS
jgi:hypothetical protein